MVLRLSTSLIRITLNKNLEQNDAPLASKRVLRLTQKINVMSCSNASVTQQWASGFRSIQLSSILTTGRFLRSQRWKRGYRYNSTIMAIMR